MTSERLVPPWAYFRTTPAVDPHDARHNARLNRVVDQLHQLRGSGALSLRKRAVSHVVPKRDDKRHTDKKIDISDLDEILHIDPAARTCTAEPGVTFVNLVRETLKHGLVPCVVPELKTITIGGAVTGCSIESMSFMYGGFHDTCVELEVVSADGEVLHCRRDGENALLFTNPQSYRDAIRAHYDARDVDFMDGIIHSPTKYVLCLGTFVDEAPYAHNYDWLRVYWESTGTRREDFLKTADYFFRSRGRRWGRTSPCPSRVTILPWGDDSPLRLRMVRAEWSLRVLLASSALLVLSALSVLSASPVFR